MIVLAIAGLIMVIVFIAVPSLQRAERNARRKSTAGLVFADLEQFVANSPGGAFPSFGNTWKNFYDHYIKGSLNDTDPLNGVSIFGPPPPDVTDKPDQIDPDYCLGTTVVGNPCNPMHSCSNVDIDETFTIPCVGNVPDTGYARIVFNAKCNGEQLVSSNGINKDDVPATQFALLMGLEPSGVTYCIDNK